MKATRSLQMLSCGGESAFSPRKHLVLEARTDGDYARDKVVFVLGCFGFLVCILHVGSDEINREDSDFEGAHSAFTGAKCSSRVRVCVEPDGKVYLRHP